MKTNNNMELRERIEEIIVTDKLVNLPASKIIDAILSEIGTCGECFHLVCKYDEQPICGKTGHYKDAIEFCSDFERGKK